MFTRRAAGSPGKGANRRRAEYGEEINFAICIIEASIRGSTGITSTVSSKSHFGADIESAPKQSTGCENEVEQCKIRDAKQELIEVRMN